jgi:LAGLIDADG DNA endonuclease family
MKTTNILYQAPVMSSNNNLPTQLRQIIIGTLLKKNYSTTKDILPISSELREILIGNLLGDLYIQRRSLKGNAYLLFEQGGKNIDYGQHLYSLFKDYVNYTPEVRSRFDKRTQKTYYRFQFCTISHPIFTEFHSLFYDPITCKKIVPINIANYLTDRSLAYWIMDDGEFTGTGLRLNTNSYTPAEIDILIDALDKNFGIKATKNFRNRAKFTVEPQIRLYISKSQLSLVKSLVMNFMYSSMVYKLG